MIRKSIQKISLADLSALSLGIVVFQLPIYQLYVSITIGAWIILSITSAIVNKNSFSINGNLISLGLFYILYVLGVIWSENKAAANFDLEVKMSFIIIPLVFMFLNYGVRQLKIVLYSFLLGCFVSMIFLLFSAFERYALTHDLRDFFYANLSYKIHPSYLSFYLNIGIGVLLLDYMFGKLKLFSKSWMYYLILSILTAFSFMLISKNGIITTALLLFFLMIFWIVKRKWSHAIILISLVCSTFLIVYNKSTFVQDRILEVKEGFQTDGTEKYLYSTSLRRVIWRKATEVYLREPLIGYGTGDATDVLIQEYIDSELSAVAIDRRLNAHNQFLQTGIAVGIFGLLLMTFFLIHPILKAKKKNYYLVLLCLITISFFLTESVLETQAGVVGFVVFYCLFNVFPLQGLDKNIIDQPNPPE